MSMGATLSILGLYNYDSTIFDLMAFPDGFTTAQKEIVRDNILAECAELEILYPAPAVMKSIIGVWSRKELPYWNRVYKASLEEYNPIENYHRTEEEDISDNRKEIHSGDDKTNMTGYNSARAGGQDKTTGSSSSSDTESGTDTTTNKISSYDSATLVDHDSSSTTYGHKNTNAASGTNTQAYGRTDDSETSMEETFSHGENINHAGNSARKLLAYGNIGVTTSQEMLTQEMEIAKIINVVPIIIESFKDRFCLMVY